jgi:hypothetical protein
MGVSSLYDVEKREEIIMGSVVLLFCDGVRATVSLG